MILLLLLFFLKGVLNRGIGTSVEQLQLTERRGKKTAGCNYKHPAHARSAYALHRDNIILYTYVIAATSFQSPVGILIHIILYSFTYNTRRTYVCIYNMCVYV